MPGHALGEIERRWAADIVCEMAIDLRLEQRVFPCFGIRSFELKNERHERLGDETAAIKPVMPVLVGPVRKELRCWMVMALQCLPQPFVSPRPSWPRR